MGQVGQEASRRTVCAKCADKKPQDTVGSQGRGPHGPLGEGRAPGGCEFVLQLGMNRSVLGVGAGSEG